MEATCVFSVRSPTPFLHTKSLTSGVYFALTASQLGLATLQGLSGRFSGSLKQTLRADPVMACCLRSWLIPPIGAPTLLGAQVSHALGQLVAGDTPASLLGFCDLGTCRWSAARPLNGPHRACPEGQGRRAWLGDARGHLRTRWKQSQWRQQLLKGLMWNSRLLEGSGTLEAGLVAWTQGDGNSALVVWADSWASSTRASRFISPGPSVPAFLPGLGCATHGQPPQEMAGMPVAHGPSVSAKSALEMGGWIKSPLCGVGGDNVYHSLHFHYGDISRSASGS